MPSYLDFDSSKNGNTIPDSKQGFRDFLIAKTLKRPNGPQTFNATNYSNQNTSDFPNKDVGGIDKNENFDLGDSLVKTQTSNTFKPLEFLVKDTFDTLPRRANLSLYPYFPTTPSNIGLIGILTSNNFNYESELMKFATDYIKNASEGPIKSRLSANLDKETNGKIRILDALNGSTSTAINIITGREQLVERNNSITVAKTLLGKGVDFLEKVAGVTAPFSEIPGDYLSNPSNPVNYRPQAKTQLGSLYQDLTGALGSLIGIQRRPKRDRKPSDLMIEYMGSGQKARLYDALSYNTYSPNYTTAARSQNTSKILNFVDRVSQGIKKFLGEEAPSSGAYIGDDRGNDVKYAMSDFNDITYKSSYYLGLMFDTKKDGGYYDGTELFHNNKNITWSNKSGVVDSSKDKKFRPNSILDRTQSILNLSPDGGVGYDHISNVISQTTKVFEDGKVRMSKGSNVKILKDKNSNVVGAEYGRAWTKIDRYETLDKTMKKSANIRKYDGSVMGGKSRPWNLNYAPMSTGGKSFEGSTNIFEKTKGQKDFYAKKYMFSIENLAWKTSTLPGFTVDSLPACERGPNGGRVMWFPPYDLKMSEQNNAKWETNSFLGRPEPIYTYQNTERTGQVEFKVVVDHPSILNLLVNEHFKDMDDATVDEHINAFFAGTEDFDFYELIKTYTTLDQNDINLIREYLNSGKDKQTIKKYKYTSVPTEVKDPTSLLNDSNKKDKQVTFLFPNDVPPKSNDSVTTDQDYTTIYSAYSGQSTSYVNELETELTTLITGPNNDDNKHDRNVIFGNEIVTASVSGSSITQAKKIVQDGFSGLTKDYTDYTTDMTILKKEISGNTVDYIAFTIVTSTSEVASDEYNFYLGVRRAYSIVKDIFKQLKNNAEPKIKWPTKEKLKAFISSGMQSFDIQKYKLKDFGYDGNIGELIIQFKTVGEKDPRCQKVIKTTYGLKDHAPTEFLCRKGAFAYKYQSNNKPAVLEDKKVQKIKVSADDTSIVPNPKPSVDVMKRIIMKTLSECYYFKKLEDTDPFVFNSLKQKLKYFHPGFHSTTPEGLNSRLTFLLQCVRPGDTLPIKGISDSNDYNARNTTFGPPPVCVLRIGDFYHSKIIIKDVNITYDDGTWDLNPEGIGIQPMIARVVLQIAFIGGQGLEKPVERLQNALSSNFFGNTEMYDERSISTTTTIDSVPVDKFTKEFLEDLIKKEGFDLQAKPGETGKIALGKYIGNTTPTGLTYTDLVKQLPIKVENYFKTFQSTWDTIVQKYGRLIGPILMSKNYRTISGCTIYSGSSISGTIELFGEYPSTSGITQIYDSFKSSMLNNIINYPSSLSDLLGLNFLTQKQKVESDSILIYFLQQLVKTKYDGIPTFKPVKDLQKSRIELVNIIDKLNYITNFGYDGQINGVTASAIKLGNPFTSSDFYSTYSNIIDFLVSKHVQLTLDIKPTIENYDDPDTFKLILKQMLNDQVTNLCKEYEKTEGFYTDDYVDYSSPTKAKLQQALQDFVFTVYPTPYHLGKFETLKSTSEISYPTVGDKIDVNGTNGNDETLRKILRDKNPLGTSLNFYKP